jgi:uncharacterized protein YjiS (DUF1127 family)
MRLGYRLAVAIRSWWSARKTRLQLGALDDRHLKDIGLSRGEIETVAHKVRLRGHGEDVGDARLR